MKNEMARIIASCPNKRKNLADDSRRSSRVVVKLYAAYVITRTRPVSLNLKATIAPARHRPERDCSIVSGES
jgi:hypothetical protein